MIRVFWIFGEICFQKCPRGHFTIYNYVGYTCRDGGHPYSYLCSGTI